MYFYYVLIKTLLYDISILLMIPKLKIICMNYILIEGKIEALAMYCYYIFLKTLLYNVAMLLKINKFMTIV